MLNILFLIIGVIVLAGGGEVLIRASLAFAKRFNISPLLSGLVIVGFGTSAPELVVSIDAAISDQPDIAVGNVIGSNIGNILLILGVCALIYPLAVKPQALKRDVSAVFVASILCLIILADGVVDRFDGIVLLVGLCVYLIGAYWSERSHQMASTELYQHESEEIQVLPKSITVMMLGMIAGLILLIGGSKILLMGAVGIAELLGVSEAVIGLTLVAVGTSLPELTISVIATMRRHTDVAIGNILGSNIFNTLGILGAAALVQPLTVSPRILQFDQWVMLGVSVLLLLFLYTGRRLSRGEGAILLLAYSMYVWLNFSVLSA